MVADLQEWLVGATVTVQAPPRTLLKHGDTIFEAHGRCHECSSPLVCELGDKNKIHLDQLPESPIEIVRN